MNTQVFTSTLVLHVCSKCGTHYGYDATLDALARKDGRFFRCTNPDCAWPSQHYSDDELARTKKLLAQAQAGSQRNREWAEREQARKEEAQRRASALKGVVTRTKRRVGNGVCPCCKRTFSALARHMESKHPGYAGGKEPRP